MSEDEYLENEPNDDDEDIIYEFLIDEPDDLTLIMVPKSDFDLEEEIERYYKQLKKCRSKEQLKDVLRDFYSYIVEVTEIQSEINHLQDRIKSLEIKMNILNQIR